MKTFRITEELQNEKGYPGFDDETRKKVFGLNSARLYGVDVEATRCTLAKDGFSTARAELLDAGPRPVGRTYGPRTRRDFLRLHAFEDAVNRARMSMRG
jgi:hypothetical protein